MSDILKRHATENYFDRKYTNFLRTLERGKFSHTAFPGWLLVRSYCVTCDEPVTVIKYHGERYELVPSGPEELGKRWVIHQCPVDNTDAYSARAVEDEAQQKHYEIGPEEGHAEPTEDEIDVHERADIEQEMQREQWPDDPYNYPDIPYLPPGEYK